MSFLELRQLTLAYGKAGATVRNLDLAVERGELVSLLGPSGCGKTTTMRAVAGLLEPTAGQIVLDGEDITRVPAHQRNIGLVFQSYALFPHLSAYENVAFGLRLRKVEAAELHERVLAALKAVGLASFEQRLPAQLSGGQQQRVALARAIVIRPRMLLLDEPLSNLDAKLRVEMRSELRRIQRELGITMLYVTHDQDEALSLSDRIVIMREGHIEQNAAPEEIYNHPATPFVASFMGYDNIFAVQGGVIQAGNGQTHPAVLPRDVAHIAWRPAQVPVTAPGSAGAGNEIEGQVLARSYLGEQVEYLVQTALGPVRGVAGASDAQWREGSRVGLRLDPANAALIKH
ncbi:MAG TPA: ABC transporter ATP-binding protein [Burkholderiaceae bacterium]|nr:ABC transporter ATP-binding protein [Burkholderiaceae bacterium]